MNTRDRTLVTGAAGGIGGAVARSLADQGTSVALLDQDSSRLDATVSELSTANAIATVCDVSSEASLTAALDELEQGGWRPNALVHCAGVGGPFHRIDEVSTEEWRWVMNTNLFSTFVLCRWLLPRLASQGGGRIVLIASLQGLLGAKLSSTYSASKHAMVG